MPINFNDIATITRTNASFMLEWKKKEFTQNPDWISNSNCSLVSYMMTSLGVSTATISIWPGDWPITAMVVFVIPNFGSNTNLSGEMLINPSCDTLNVISIGSSECPLKT